MTLQFINITESKLSITTRERVTINRHCQSTTERVKRKRGSRVRSRDYGEEWRNSSPENDTPSFKTHSSTGTPTKAVTRLFQPPKTALDSLGKHLEPFDCLPMPSDPLIHACINHYVCGMNLKPFATGPRLAEQNATVSLRTTSWLPFAATSVSTYAALVAFLLTSPTLPQFLRNDRLTVRSLSLAIADIAKRLQNPVLAISEETLFAVGLLALTACNMQDVAAVEMHIDGMVNIMKQRNAESAGYPAVAKFHSGYLDAKAKHSSQDPGEISEQWELGFDDLYALKLTSRNLRNEYRHRQGRSDYVALSGRDPFMPQFRLQFSAIQWLGHLTPADNDELRPLEKVCINAIMAVGYMATLLGSPVLTMREHRVFIAIYTGLLHDDLFEGEGEEGLQEIGEIYPGVLAWVALAAGTFIKGTSESRARDFAWLLRKALWKMGMWEFNGVCAYMARTFTWSESMNYLITEFWGKAELLFGGRDESWAAKPWVRPR